MLDKFLAVLCESFFGSINPHHLLWRFLTILETNSTPALEMLKSTKKNLHTLEKASPLIENWEFFDIINLHCKYEQPP